MITAGLLKEMTFDMEKCEKAQKTAKSSLDLYDNLVAKYTVIFPDFDKKIGNVGKALVSGTEIDYRPELLNVKDKLKAYIIKESNNPISMVQKRVLSDISKIDKIDALSEEEIEQLYHSIINYYSIKIRNLGDNLYGYIRESNSYADDIGLDSIKDNLIRLKYKLESFYDDGCINQLDSFPSTQVQITNQNEFSSNVNIDINIEYEKAKDKIDNNPNLSDEDVEELNNKLEELKIIIESKDNKRKKWNSAKSIFQFVMDKGFDVAIAFLPLMLNL